MHLLKQSSQKPQRQKLKQRAHDADVDQAVGEGLPKPAMQEGHRNKAERILKIIGGFSKRHLCQRQQKVGAKIHKNQCARSAFEVWERKRAGTDPAHRSPQVKRLGGPVSSQGVLGFYRKAKTGRQTLSGPLRLSYARCEWLVTEKRHRGNKTWWYILRPEGDSVRPLT